MGANRQGRDTDHPPHPNTPCNCATGLPLLHGLMTMSKSEREWVHSDVFGKWIHERAETERRQMAVEAELAKLPPSEQLARTRAMGRNPPLLVSSPYVQLVRGG